MSKKKQNTCAHFQFLVFRARLLGGSHASAPVLTYLGIYLTIIKIIKSKVINILIFSYRFSYWVHSRLAGASSRQAVLSHILPVSLRMKHEKTPETVSLNEVQILDGEMKLWTRIARNSSNVVCPVIDVISDDTLEYQGENNYSYIHVVHCTLYLVNLSTQ